jgi:Protein of unknown function (DUF2750)
MSHSATVNRVEDRTTRALSTYRPNASAINTFDAPGIVDLFLQGVALSKLVWTISGQDGIAHIPSPSDQTRNAYLFWSTPHEAGRWADVLAEQPQLVSMPVTTFLTETLFQIADVGGTIATDWSSEPVEPELDPVAVGRYLADALVKDFVVIALKTRTVFVLHDLSGIAAVTPVGGGPVVVPVWADRASAEATAAQFPEVVAAVRMPLADLTGRYLLSATGLRSRFAPAYVHTPGVVAFAPWQFKALLNGNGSPAARVA